MRLDPVWRGRVCGNTAVTCFFFFFSFFLSLDLVLLFFFVFVFSWSDVRVECYCVFCGGCVEEGMV